MYNSGYASISSITLILYDNFLHYIQLNVTGFTIFSPIDSAFISNVAGKKETLSDDTISIHYSPFYISLTSLLFTTEIPTISLHYNLITTSNFLDSDFSICNIKISSPPIYDDGYVIVYSIKQVFKINFADLYASVSVNSSDFDIELFEKRQWRLQVCGGYGYGYSKGKMMSFLDLPSLTLSLSSIRSSTKIGVFVDFGWCFRRFWSEFREQGKGRFGLVFVGVPAMWQRWPISDVSSNFTIEVGSASFALHKFPLISRSERIRKLLLKANDTKVLRINLIGLPGGSNAFELAAKFCYRVNVEITISNVTLLRCAARFMKMTEDISEKNLEIRTEVFLKDAVFPNISNSISVLHRCETFLPLSEEVNLVSQLINAITNNACKEQLTSDLSKLEYSFSPKAVQCVDSETPSY
ncbi:putative dnaJ -like protein subfamily C member 14-like [Capsicum annuum]|nr:putative dnaJ -like protein subfamily C member 14-like [Capsicum annuum]